MISYNSDIKTDLCIIFHFCTRDEELLRQGLVINDRLHSLLIKHDAVASGLFFPVEERDASPRPTEVRDASSKQPEVKDVSPRSNSSSSAAINSFISSQFEEEEEKDDNQTQLAHREREAVNKYCNNRCRCNTKRPVTPESDSSEISEGVDGLALLADTTEVPSNVLALPSPPMPSNTINEENDMIDLLSITLSTTSVSPDSPRTPPSPFDQPINPYAAYTYPESQTQITYKSYVAPWAQAQPQNHLQLQLPQFSYYPPSPWTSPTPNYGQSPLSNMKPYKLLNNTNASPFQMPMQMQAATPIQNHNPFTSTAINGSSATGQKVYVPPYKLFDDLNVFGNVSGGLKATNNPFPNFSGMPGQSMVGGRI
ncbi:hypothetical protein GIB67_008076 [Kingdonia uniflora]|uniref:Uncharacterized protein n=1 Tax=Kingdonia uniflora TaxID=39325 RepID=A0A7J7MCN6_9MAGN|nr:hypothetical protein GIB67_008076 [Kingdonia uniflora]